MLNEKTKKMVTYIFIIITVNSILFKLLGENVYNMENNNLQILTVNETRNLESYNYFTEQHLKRVKIMKEQCSVYGKNMKAQRSGSYITEKQTKTSFCSIHKIASSSMNLIYLKYIPDKSIQKQLLDNHKAYNVRNYFNAKKNNISEEELKEYFWYLFVRHPFDRFLSGYTNRIMNGCTGQAKQLIPKIYRDVSRNVHCITKIPLFNETVQYFIDHDEISRHDHFALINDICLPCSHNFSAVYKIDDDNDFYEDLFQRTGLTGLKLNINPTIIEEGVDLRKQYFSQLTCKQTNGLYKVLKADFKLFDYKPYTYIQNCDITS